MEHPDTLYIVVPCYNEEEVLPETARTALLDTIPMKRLGTGADVAAAAAFFASEEAGYLTGQVLCVDGGMAV